MRNRFMIAVTLILLTMAGIIVEGIIAVRNIQKKSEASPVKNVFDQMIESEYEVIVNAEQIKVGGYDAFRLTYPVVENPKIQIGLIYSSQYRKLYIYGDVEVSEDVQDVSYQEYYEACLERSGITWSELEDYKEEFICGEILEPWFERSIGNFTKEELGELEVIDYLMPYGYCGMDETMEKKKSVSYGEEDYDGLFKVKVKYTTWRGPDSLICIQKSRYYDYKDILDRIEDDIRGINTSSERFTVEHGTRLADIIKMEQEFYDWVKESGKVKGTLTKLSYRREEGEIRTQKLLKSNWVFENNVVFSGTFYFDDEYLYILCPCNKDETGQLVANGKGNVWQGWLAIRWEDIQEYVR